ncbi:hypothetical protein [Limosilactobacillus antri]|uniref:hypothetical protein n=1 Tax=Limosilactobacillus antri TaxID=227943 RepID=UPI001F5AE8CE|nr:hypothetical protein [Limosilactobacillus antri]
MTDIAKMQAELQRLQEKQEVLKARQERQQARLNAEKRKQRNKRLIEKGAVLEDMQAVVKGLKKVPKVPRVSKAEDPEGYAKYQAYKTYNHQKEQISEKISPADSQEWLETLIEFSKWVSHFTLTDSKTGEKESTWERFTRIQSQNNQRS